MFNRGVGAFVVGILLALTTTTGLAAPKGDYMYEGYIYYGDTIENEVTTDYGDIWNLDGSAGDVIYISILRSSMEAEVELYSSGDDPNIIASGGCNGDLAAVEAFTLPYTGMYLINVDGCGTEIGSYSINVFRTESGISPRGGFNAFHFEASKGQPAKVTIPYPEGSTYVYAICAIEGYIPFDDDGPGQDQDMGWSCTWQKDDINKAVYFTLTPLGSDAGTIKAKAIVLDNEVFQVLQSYSFTADWSGAVFEDLIYGGTSSSIKLYGLPENSFPIVHVTDYITEGDDDFSFGLDATPAEGEYSLSAWGGDEQSYVHGFVVIAQPIDPNARAFYCFVGNRNISSLGFDLSDGNCSSSYIDPDMMSLAFGSLMVLSNDEADLFSTEISFSTYRENKNFQLEGWMNNFMAGENSWSTYEIVVLQRLFQR